MLELRSAQSFAVEQEQESGLAQSFITVITLTVRFITLLVTVSWC